MRIIPNIEALNLVEDDALVEFIKESSPWLAEGFDSETVGYVFILYEEDSFIMTKVYCVPHLPFANEDYREIMTIDLTTFEDWEYVMYNKKSKYYQALAIFGSDYGADLYMSESFVSAVPNLKNILDNSIRQECDDVE